MLKNYINIAWRNLTKQKILTFINISGLSIGMGCFSLFMLYAVSEFSFDRFHLREADIFRLVQWQVGLKGMQPGGDAGTPVPLGPAIKKDLPDVENFVRFQQSFGQKFVKINDKVTRSDISFADPQIFSVFSFKLIEGSPTAALFDLHSIVLTRDKAIQLFGQTHVLGKRIDIKIDDQFVPFTVGGVAENIPFNSSIQFGLLGSFDYLLQTSMGMQAGNDWHMTIGMETYVELRKSSNLAGERGKLAKFRQKYFPEEQADLKKSGLWNGIGAFPMQYVLQPMSDVHTNPKIEAGYGPGDVANPSNIWILISIACAVLLIACINFTTLAIGRSSGRAKEVGLRKVIGGTRQQLIRQFLTESLLLSVLSAVLGLLWANLFLPWFNQLAGTEIGFSFSQYPQIIWMLVGLTLLVGILAGTYPAFVLSSFRPVEALKNKFKLGGSNLFTKSLVTVQFVLSVALIISTVVILQQLTFLHSKDLGFNKENVVMVDATGTDTKKVYPLFKHALLADSHVNGVTGSEIGLGDGEGEMGGGFNYKDQRGSVIEYPVDGDYLTVMGMKLLTGRNFDPKITSDTVTSILVNEAMIRSIGLTLSNAVGQQLKVDGPQKQVSRQIIGVVKDFNFEPLSRTVRPQIFSQPSGLQPSRFFIRLMPGDPAPTLAGLEAAWKTIAPEFPFKYAFVDERMEMFYKSEARWSKIVGWAGGVCIFLACLGLFGLAALTAVNRTKEISIRKILGAPFRALVGLLYKDFYLQIAIAFSIACPLAWYVMNKWLENYAYRIKIGPGVFISTGAITVCIVLITIGYQALKSAFSNPVESLRAE